MPDRAEVDALDPAFLRTVLYHVVDDLERILALGRPLLISLNNEADMVAGWSGWEQALAYVANRAGDRLVGVTCGNELDVYWSRNPADVGPTFGAELVNRAGRTLAPYGVRVGTTSLGGPLWPAYLIQMLTMCRPDFVALNPYGWIFEGVEAKVASVRSITGLPLVFPELGCKIGDAGGERGQADALLAASATCDRLGIEASWFARHDLDGAPWERGQDAFGLRREDGSRRPAWKSFASLGKDDHMPTDQFDVGQGLRAWMAEVGDRPIASSTFLPLGRNPAQIENAYGASGAEYRWSLVENRRLALIRPDAVA